MPILKIYNYSSDTHEFISESDGYIDENTQLIPYCTTIPPIKSKKGYAVIFNSESNQWEYQVDHRGHIAYQTENRQQVHIDFIGALPPTLTLLEPQTEFDKWNGKKWVIDTDAQKAMLIAQAEFEKSQRLEDAERHIVMLERKIRLGMATNEEIELHKQWEIYSINVADIDTSTTPDIEWPVKP